MNTGARSLTGGFSRKMAGAWWNASVTAYFGRNRTISTANNTAFAGHYSNHGFTVGLGVRR
ncbi:MAG: hypothetical protein AB7J13_05385 [Pyrinomonadaceae bacterium]